MSTISTIIIRRGPAGADGSQGATGAAGSTGATGSAGATGPAGPAPSGTGFVKVSGGTLTTPSATIPHTDITGLGTAATADTTVTGAANGVLKVTSSGDVNLMGAAPTGTAASIGGVFMPDSERLWFLNNTNKADGASIYFNTDHDSSGGELYLASPNRVALLPGVFGAIQIGIASGLVSYESGGNKQFAYMQKRGYCRNVGGARKTDSLPLYFMGGYWDGVANIGKDSLAGSIQAVPADELGNVTLDFSSRATTPNGVGGDGSRPLDMQLTPAGLWEAGKAPSFEVLPDDGTRITQTCSKYHAVQSAAVTLVGSRTLLISGLKSGMRGIIYVTQDGTGSRALTPSGGTSLSISTAAGTTDRVSWEFDGTFVNFSIVLDVQREVMVSDSDAAAFIAAASLSDSNQKAAISILVESLKASNVDSTGTLWSKCYALYPFVGGNATAHSKELKGTYNITNSGTNWATDITHDANGITGNGTSGYGLTSFDFDAVSALNSASIYVYCKTQTPTDGGFFVGAVNTANGSRAALLRSGASVVINGVNANTTTGSLTADSDFRKHLAVARSDASNQNLYVNASVSGLTIGSLTACNRDFTFLARNNGGTATTFSNANLAFGMFGQHLTATEWTAFRTIIDTFQTALGRANP